MSFLYEPRPFPQSSKQRGIEDILDKARPDRDYYLLLVGAGVLAVGAIMTDSIPVLIASMIVAPLSAPIIALSLGVTAGNWRIMLRSILLLFISTAITLLIAVTAAIVLKNDRIPDILISFNGNRTIAVIVAFASGVIAAYGVVRPKVSSAFVGIAIAVSLMPPLVATGIGLAPGGTPFDGALSLYLLNIVGITIACTITFLILGLGKVARTKFRKE
ncbi:MAG TPA: DUF389 domain-containing protein [Candidatus Saccharimonadales bacterium]|nr:DUF389 domain-containing protein [Candidatus Saccharimonadales bacterium]